MSLNGVADFFIFCSTVVSYAMISLYFYSTEETKNIVRESKLKFRSHTAR